MFKRLWTFFLKKSNTRFWNDISAPWIKVDCKKDITLIFFCLFGLELESKFFQLAIHKLKKYFSNLLLMKSTKNIQSVARRKIIKYKVNLIYIKENISIR